MTNRVLLARDDRRRSLRCSEKRHVDRASGSDRSGDDKLDEVPAIWTQDQPPCKAVSTNSVAICGDPCARRRSRYQSMMAAREKTKMMVEMALISGVMPRRNRPQISSGRVLSRPIRKKLTAISSIERVKMSRAAPIIGRRRLGIVTRQKVCQ